jgi:hypothetical protein
LPSRRLLEHFAMPSLTRSFLLDRPVKPGDRSEACVN